MIKFLTETVILTTVVIVSSVTAAFIGANLHNFFL